MFTTNLGQTTTTTNQEYIGTTKKETRYSRSIPHNLRSWY